MGNPLDARSDVYSLGVLAYRMLSGSLPFTGPNARDFLVQHIGTPPVPLVEAAPVLAEDVDLASIVMRCLSKDARARFQTADELVRALESPPRMAGRLLPALPRAISSVSEVIFARRPAQPAPGAKPAPLLELPTGANTPVPPPTRVADTLSTPRPRRWLLPAAVGAAVVLGGLGTLLWGGGRDPIDEARAQLDGSRPREAMQTLERLEKSGTPAERLAGLRAAAQHALRDHDAEMRTLWSARSSDAVLDPRALRALTEDLAREGGEGPRKDFLDGLPAARTTAALKAIAESGISESAWGALRTSTASTAPTPWTWSRSTEPGWTARTAPPAPRPRAGWGSWAGPRRWLF